MQGHRVSGMIHLGDQGSQSHPTRETVPIIMVTLVDLILSLSLRLTVVMHGADVLVEAEGLAPRVGLLLHRLHLTVHLDLDVLHI